MSRRREIELGAAALGYHPGPGLEHFIAGAVWADKYHNRDAITELLLNRVKASGVYEQIQVAVEVLKDHFKACNKAGCHLCAGLNKMETIKKEHEGKNGLE
jgi:hypothetical protein